MTPLIKGHLATTNDDVQLNTTTLIRHAARTHGEREIVFRTSEGWGRTTYAETYARIKRGANALRGLGVQPGDCVGILDWNNRRHFELYWSIPGVAAVMVQLNLRLAPADVAYVATDAAVSVICVDESLLPLAEAIAPQLPGVRTWVILSDRPMAQIETSLPNAVHYDDLLAEAEPEIDWPEIDERSAYAACYTTGTTGRPKGVFYSHRAIYLHSYAIVANLGMTIRDCLMLVTPMFHCQSWGLPQAGILTASKIVLPGRYTMDEIPALSEVLIAEGVTVTNGAPAIFAPMLEHLRTLPEAPDLSRLRMLSGSTEPPLSLMRGFRELTGAEVIHAYGATETAPIVTVNLLKPELRERLSEDEQFELKRKQGFPVTGVDVRVVGPLGEELPADGTSAGEVQVRGAWVTTTYHGMSAEETAERFDDGWWRTGDVGTLDADGYLKLTDRLKDVIKSGGEWISSIDMENLLMSHPKVKEAAVVGLDHPVWQERPFALVVPREGDEVTAEELREHLSSAFSSWQVPDDFEIVVQIPRTSVGKFDKKAIRARYARRFADAAPNAETH